MADMPSLISKILSLSEERLGVAVGELLSSDRFLKAVEQAVSSGSAARLAVERGLSKVLRAMNVPTLEDLTQVEQKLEELEELIAEAMLEVDRIEKHLRKTKPIAKPARKKKDADVPSNDEAGE